MPLSAASRVFLKKVYRPGAPLFHERLPQDARDAFEKLSFAFRPDPPKMSAVTSRILPTADGGGVAARYYRPLQAHADTLLPLVLFFHGGGWCLGSLGSHDLLCRQLANRSGCAVLSVDYRLAPEYPFPAGLSDAWAAFQWAATPALGAQHGFDSGRLALVGDSAGGNFALVCALMAREAGAVPALRCVIPIYPVTTIESSRPARQSFGNGYWLDTPTLNWFFQHYLPDPKAARDWRVSPLLAPSLSGLPPISMIQAECDPLVDDGTAFAERIRSEGGEIEVLCYPGMVHGFILFTKLFEAADEAVYRAAIALRARLRAPLRTG